MLFSPPQIYYDIGERYIMKRKVLLIGLMVVLLVLIPVGILTFMRLSSGKIADGIYKIKDNPDYPNAYIKVSGDSFQVFNLDMNRYWQEKQLDFILRMQNNENLEFDSGYTEEELRNLSDLNKLYVDKPYHYDSELRDKQGTYRYDYPCLSAGNLFGIYLEYDAWNHTLTIVRNGIELRFEK